MSPEMSPEGKSFRRLSFVVALGLLVVGLLISIVTHPTWDEVVRDIGIAALVVGTIGFLDFILIRREFQRVTEIAVEGVFENQQQFGEAGLIRVHRTLDRELLEREFGNAKRIRILQTWTAFDDQDIVYIKSAAKNECIIDILLLDPFSDQVWYRARALPQNQGEDMDQGFARNRIMTDLKALCTLEQHYRIRVRVYDAAPTIAMYEFDRTKLIGIYWRNLYTIQGPQLEVASSRACYLTKIVDDTFDGLWGDDESKTLNLTLDEYMKWTTYNEDLDKKNQPTLTLEEYRQKP